MKIATATVPKLKTPVSLVGVVISATGLAPSVLRGCCIMLRLAAVVAIADAALPIALATTVGAGSCDRLRLRSVASLIASSMETLSHLDDAASDGSGEVCLCCIGSEITAHEVEDDPDESPVLCILL